MLCIRPHNWAEFQHYNKRNPPWIKLYRKLLDDMKWHALPLASRALAPLLWLLASEHKEGIIMGDEVEISFRLRVSKADLLEALKPLMENGMFEDASMVLAGRLQLAPESCSESERETERESERDASAALAPKGARGVAQEKAKKGPTTREEWETRLAGYLPSKGQRVWPPFWGPRPDAPGDGHGMPRDLLTKWRVQNSVVNRGP